MVRHGSIRASGSVPIDGVPRRAAGGHASEVAALSPSGDLTPIVGANLRRIRRSRGLSLARLSEASSVSRAMLSQVELGKSTPTINVLWRIARALGISFSALISDDQELRSIVLRAGSSRVLSSRDGEFVSRALFPTDGPRNVEFYELRLAARSIERAEPHPLGTKENLVVARGFITVVIGAERHGLDAGDAIFFAADVPHEYCNDGGEDALLYLVVTYVPTIPATTVSPMARAARDLAVAGNGNPHKREARPHREAGSASPPAGPTGRNRHTVARRRDPRDAT